jgi:PAS domain S-box-containing protein
MSVEWHFLITLNEQLRPHKDPIAIQEVAVRLLGEHLLAHRVNYATIDGDEFVISESYADGIPPFAGRRPVARFGKAIVDAYRRGETAAVDDVETDARLTDAEREQLLADGTAAFVGTPLIKGGRWLASLSVHSVTPRTWTHDQIALVEITADRTWSAAERARAEEALGRSEGRQAFLHRLNDTIRRLADPAQILDEACGLLGTYLGVNRVAYGEIAGDDCTIVHDYVDGVPSLTGHVPWRTLGGSRTADILKGWTLSVNDTSTESHTADERAALEAADIKAYICPLLIKDGRFAASFGIHSRSPRVWTADEITLVEEVADRIWTTLEHRRAEAELRANEERLAFLLRLNDAVRPLSDPAAIQETAARHLCEFLGAARAGYAELERREYVIRHEHTRGVEPLAGMPLRITTQGMLGDALRRGETIAVHDIRTDRRLSDDDRAAFQSRQIEALVGVARFKDGQMVAAFGVNHDAPRVWTAREIELVREVAERTWDAVERSRAEAALREQRTRLRLALEASAGGSWTWDLRTNDADWDEVFRARFGFTPDEMPLFETWLARVHDHDRPRLLRTFEEVLQARDTWDHTYRILRPDGAVRWMQSLGRADRDPTGRVTRLTGLELDVTERRRTEDVLQARRDEEHDRALRTLLETATQGIVSADASGIVVFANHALESMFGWTAAELIGQPIDRLIPSVFHDTTSSSGAMEPVGARKDESLFPIEVTVNYVPTRDGGRIFAFVTDITERQRAAMALLDRTTELEYRTTQLSRMAWDLTLAEHHAREQIANTLHDGLQQLLVVVALDLEQQLKRDNEIGAAPSELLTEAKQQVDEAIAVARSLNVELFPPVLHRSGLPAALTWLANWTRDKYKLGVEVVADPRADSPRKDVRTLLFESVRELLFNAVKYAKTDRVSLMLEIDGGSQLCITVADQGVGFDPARLDDRSKAGQVGWGLFRIRERLTLLGGSLDIDSAPGRGTRVRLVAPRDAAQDTFAGGNELSLALTEASSAGGNDRASADALRILIVDDHPAVRRALRELLHQRPQLSVVGDASNGFEAITFAHTLRPDVILMDVAMPHMDGVEATARICTELPDIRILGLSMLARNEIADAIEQAGAAGFFVKGTDTPRLIEHLLDFHASRTAGDGSCSSSPDSPSLNSASADCVNPRTGRT